MGTTQSGVSRLERQDDIRVSTLREYAAALGGRLRLIVECGETQFEVSLEDQPDEHGDAARIWRLSGARVPADWRPDIAHEDLVARSAQLVQP